MATFTPVIIKHHKKVDGTWNAKIRISQKGKSVYLDTNVQISKSEVDSKFKIKKSIIVERFGELLKDYYAVLTPELNDYGDAAHIKQKIQEVKSASRVEYIDFIAVCEKIVKETEQFTSKNSAIPLRTITNSLKDYIGKNGRSNSKILSPTEITSHFLKDYEKFLRSPRHMVRLNQFGNPVVTKSPGLTDAGVFKHMSNLRLMFNSCRSHYNDDDIGKIVIPNNPFVKYKLIATRKTIKRSLTINELVTFYNTTPQGKRESIAKDMFFLSFFLCGMNSVDIYNYSNKLEVIDGRIGYNRSKTMGRRMDSAFISIYVPDQVPELLDRYKGSLQKRYSNDRTFNKALNLGLKSIGERIGIGNVTFYYARHTFATIARNECRFSKDDIAEALNHVDSSMRVTDDYITKDWKIIDDVQSAVLKLFFDMVNEFS